MQLRSPTERFYILKSLEDQGSMQKKLPIGRVACSFRRMSARVSEMNSATDPI